MHTSETLPEIKTGHLRSVRGVHLPTVPREPPSKWPFLIEIHILHRHRDASQHACPVPEPVVPPKNEAAHALLAKHFSGVSAASTSASAPKRKVPTDPKKLAQFQKVEFMKMRHRAVPADPSDKPGSIGIDQRLHVRVSSQGDPEAPQKIFWFRKVSLSHLVGFPISLMFLWFKTVGTGRALDMLARHFKLQSTKVRTQFVISLMTPHAFQSCHVCLDAKRPARRS